MNKKISLILILALALSLVILPSSTGKAAKKTMAVSLISTTPDLGVPDHTENMGGNMLVNFWDRNVSVPAGTQVVLKFAASAKPQMAVVIGDMQSWSYDASTGIATVTAKTIPYWGKGPGDSVWHYMDSALMVAVGSDPGGKDGDDGPPKEAAGMWMSTNAQDWGVMPSGDMDGDKRPDSLRFKITGKAGTSCWLKMYWPPALLKVMKLTPKTLVGFIDGERTSIKTEPVAGGGAILTINVTMSSSLSKPKILANSVTKIITTGKTRAITLSLNRKRIKKGRRAKLYGWTSSKKAGIKVVILRKRAGEKKFKKWATKKTNRKGFFRLYVKPKKSTSYKALIYIKTRKGKKAYRSKTRKVRVKK